MDTKNIIKKCIDLGLFSSEEETYFLYSGCEYCANGLGCTVVNCKGYTSLDDTKKDDYYEFRICSECLNIL